MPQKCAINQAQATSERTFEKDWRFLLEHLGDKVFLLSAQGSSIIVCPFAGGTVLTSTCDGKASHGYLDYDNAEKYGKGIINSVFHGFGGENRRWQGPEGTQFGFFVSLADNQQGYNWQTPQHMHIEPANLHYIDNTLGLALFRQTVRGLKNLSGTSFDLDLERRIRILKREDIGSELDLELTEGVFALSHETRDLMTNSGKEKWLRKTGIPVDWVIGQFDSSPNATVVVPIKRGHDSELGPKVSVLMSGESSSGATLTQDRLIVEDDTIFFRGDGGYRSKIAIPPRRSTGILGSYDASCGRLTIVKYTKHPELTENDYVSSRWTANDPFIGEDASVYNNDGGGRRSFFELESIAPARELEPGQSNVHMHQTFHFRGPMEELDKIAEKTLGVRLDMIQNAFGGSTLPEIKKRSHF